MCELLLCSLLKGLLGLVLLQLDVAYTEEVTSFKNIKQKNAWCILCDKLLDVCSVKKRNAAINLKMFGRAAIEDHHIMLWPDLNSFIQQLILL